MKIIVAHPFQQHSFKTAAALKDANYLCKYITTVYFKKHTLTYLLSKILKGNNLKRLYGRRSIELDDNDVIVFSEFNNLLLLFLQRVDKKKNIYNWWYWKTIDSFNKKLFNYIKKEKPDAIIVYDTVSYSLIKRIMDSKINVKIIVDMSAPNALYMKKIFDDEAKNETIYSTNDKQDLNNNYFLKKCNAAKIEINNADAFLVASEFTKKSLEWSKIDSSKIYKCIYNVVDSSYDKNDKIEKGDNIKCCFIGKVCLQKGAYRLFKAIDTLERKDLEFHFYGSYNKDSEYYKKYCNKVYFHGHIPHDDMLNVLKQNDVVIFPSLADGFGFSVTEGLLRKNIAICSENAGVSELIENNINGFTYNPTNNRKLSEILEKLNRKEIRKMQEKCPETILKYDTNYYNKKIIEAVASILKEDII